MSVEKAEQLLELKKEEVKVEGYIKNSEEGSENEWHNKMKLQKIKARVNSLLLKM